MDDKIVYLFRESGNSSYDSWFVISKGRGGSANSIEGTLTELRRLRKEGYTIIDRDVPIGKLFQKPEKYRQLTKKERKELS
jgi:hypothetical protein